MKDHITVFSIDITIKIVPFVKARQIDEEQGNTHPKQNPTYKQYVILERMGVDTVVCLT